MDKILGLIYGQYIGDALGTRYEFKSSRRATEKIAEDTVNGFLPILGEGPFNVPRGSVTDDTELHSALFQSLRELGCYNKEDVARRYIKWYNSGPFDVGTTTSRAFSGAKNYEQVIQNSSEENQHSLSNGCLMRISALGIYGLKLDQQALLELARENCRMTNPNLLTQDCVAVYCLALKAALEGSDRQTIYNKALSVATLDTTKTLLRNAVNAAEPAVTPEGDSVMTDSSNMGYCGIALQNAFYELLNGRSFAESLLNIIKRGGDTDTTGCIAGSLLGAYYGVNSIPEQWKTAVKIDNPRSKEYSELDQLHLEEHTRELVEKLGLRV